MTKKFLLLACLLPLLYTGCDAANTGDSEAVAAQLPSRVSDNSCLAPIELSLGDWIHAHDLVAQGTVESVAVVEEFRFSETGSPAAELIECDPTGAHLALDVQLSGVEGLGVTTDRLSFRIGSADINLWNSKPGFLSENTLYRDGLWAASGSSTLQWEAPEYAIQKGQRILVGLVKHPDQSALLLAHESPLILANPGETLQPQSESMGAGCVLLPTELMRADGAQILDLLRQTVPTENAQYYRDLGVITRSPATYLSRCIRAAAHDPIDTDAGSGSDSDPDM